MISSEVGVVIIIINHNQNENLFVPNLAIIAKRKEVFINVTYEKRISIINNQTAILDSV